MPPITTREATMTAFNLIAMLTPFVVVWTICGIAWIVLGIDR